MFITEMFKLYPHNTESIPRAEQLEQQGQISLTDQHPE